MLTGKHQQLGVCYDSLGFRSHAALKATAKSIIPGQRRFAYLGMPQLCQHLWEHGYGISDGKGKSIAHFVAPVHGILPYAHRAQGPEWSENGPLIAYTRPRHLVDCCKLVLREVQRHSDRHYREVLGAAAQMEYERACKTFFQPGILLEAVDEMGIDRTVEPGLTISYNFTTSAFLAGIGAAQCRYNGLERVNRELAEKTLSFDALWRDPNAVERAKR